MIVNRQHQVRVPLKEIEKFLTRARRALGLPAGSFTICLVTNAEIARWNRAYRHKRGPTDVLSFPADAKREKSGRTTKYGSPPARGRRLPPFASSASYLGDIAIAPAVARRNARRFGRTFADEMRILIVHGILHLMGYDHETDTGQMDRRERRLRRALGLS
ncbi:MAG TPA: rRNA maturation RNase YbeY [Candidatus Polarisedimenticolia bacterium]|nr:rRNA maturation RNase YbeY [Candidatus Polarisedimenticolia bacterium]